MDVGVKLYVSPKIIMIKLLSTRIAKMAAIVSLICPAIRCCYGLGHNLISEYRHQRRVFMDIAGFDAVDYFKLVFPD